MTINELIKSFITEQLEHLVSRCMFDDRLRPEYVDITAEGISKFIAENYQPKTTSTDIEELRQRFYRELCNTHNRGEERLLRGVTIDDIFDFFLPHVSNKPLNTDIEELNDLFDKTYGDWITQMGKDKPFGNLLSFSQCESIKSFFAPHLSNNSELNKEKTTSTDIEEKELVSLNIKIATKDLVKRVDAIIPEMDLHSKISLRGKIIRLIAEELAPRLSNKSELKKEAVQEFMEFCWDGGEHDGWIIAKADEYFSSNEKEEQNG